LGLIICGVGWEVYNMLPWHIGGCKIGNLLKQAILHD